MGSGIVNAEADLRPPRSEGASGAPAPQTADRDGAWSTRDRVAIAAMIVFSAVLASRRLGTKDLWLDEADTWYVVSGGVSHMLSVIGAWDINGSPYYAAMWVWTRAGDSETWLRLPSTLAGLATIPLVATLGRHLFDRSVGLLAALLLSTSGAMLVHAQEARPYTLATLLAATSSLLLLRAFRLGSGSAWALYALGSIALVSVHLFGLLVVAGHAAWIVLTQPRRLRRAGAELLGAAAAILAVSVPLAAAILGQHAGYGGEYVGEPWQLRTYVPVARFWAGGSRLSMFLLLIPVLAVIATLARSLRRRNWEARTRSDWFVLLGIVVPTALLALVSLGPNLVLARYLIVSVPCVVVLIARGLQLLPRQVAATLLVLVLTGSLHAAATWLDGDPIHQFEELTARLVEQLEPDDRIAFMHEYDRLGVLYYSRDIAPEALPTLVADEELVPTGWRGRTVVADPLERARQGRTWVIAHVEEGAIIEDDAEELEQWAQQGLEPSSVTMFPDRALVEFGGSDR